MKTTIRVKIKGEFNNRHAGQRLIKHMENSILYAATETGDYFKAALQNRLNSKPPSGIRPWRRTGKLMSNIVIMPLAKGYLAGNFGQTGQIGVSVASMMTRGKKPWGAFPEAPYGMFLEKGFRMSPMSLAGEIGGAGKRYRYPWMLPTFKNEFGAMKSMFLKELAENWQTGWMKESWK